EQTALRLVSAAAAVGRAETLRLGLEFELKPGWKIYWRSPGEAGFPPRLDWTGSANLEAATIAWPAPQRFSVLGLETVGYEGNVVLPIHARVAHTGEPLEARAALDYLTCSDICIPYQTTLALTLPAAAPPQEIPGFGPLIARYAAQVPGDGRSSGLALAGAMLHPGTPGQLDITVRSDRPLGRADAFVEGADRVAFGAPVLRQGPGGDETLLRLTVSGPPAEVAALAGRRLTITLVDGARAMTGTVTPELGAPALDLAALWPMLAIALLGGLILNAMPCVLPVLSLKLLGAIEHHSGARSVRVGFLATAVGILLSFLALAFATIGLAGAGVAVGWGMQFQSPLFLAAMIALVTLFAANLWGFYEVPLPRAAADLAGRAALGNVATGAFATLLATPCSAPFLGTAVGFALASGPVETVAIFLALGVGFAAPYLLVAAVPALVRFLPRPGRWMLALRRVLGLALAGTALWLLSVVMAERGTAVALAVGVLMAALAAGLALLRPGILRRGIATALVVAALAVPALSTPPPVHPETAGGGPWRPFDAAALGTLVQSGRVVFVDVTADWCLTCKVNERLVLDSAPVRARLAAPGVVAMRADWTRPDAAIAAYLRRFGRYGIPFNAVYGPGAPAGVALPEILTADAVRAALRQAAGGTDRRG
ncbi:MAG TPA: protein-disulfide reductase DsbD domain-containing protein, partial [Stellaceae bacterium]|nr:protein-disulfide reductase DsbD domain-containing protein [Stellaceae bacterium]